MAEEPRRGPPVVEIVLPSYITKPAEDEKFYPSEVKAVAEKVSKSNDLLVSNLQLYQRVLFRHVAKRDLGTAVVYGFDPDRVCFKSFR